MRAAILRRRSRSAMVRPDARLSRPASSAPPGSLSCSSRRPCASLASRTTSCAAHPTSTSRTISSGRSSGCGGSARSTRPCTRATPASSTGSPRAGAAGARLAGHAGAYAAAAVSWPASASQTCCSQDSWRAATRGPGAGLFAGALSRSRASTCARPITSRPTCWWARRCWACCSWSTATACHGAGMPASPRSLASAVP